MLMAQGRQTRTALIKTPLVTLAFPVSIKDTSPLKGNLDFLKVYLRKYKSVISEDPMIVRKELPYMFTRSGGIFLSVHSVHSCAMESYFCEYRSWQNAAEQPFRVSAGSRESAVLVFSITILSSHSVTDGSYSCVD